MKKIMYNYSTEDHRRRLLNLKYVNSNIRSFDAKHLISNYMPGHYIYPTKQFDTPENDDARLKKLAENGVDLVQIWEDTVIDANGNSIDNAHRLIDGHMYAPVGKKIEETTRFLDMAHKYGLKVLPYTSTNFYVRDDEFFHPEWALPPKNDLYYLAHCSPNSPGWRAEIMRQFTYILDNYDYDGIYCDCGYVRLVDADPHERYYVPEFLTAADDILAFEETHLVDGGMEDMLSLIYGEIKSRGGIFKLHKEGIDRVRSDMKFYDYLWVGEGVRNIDFIRRTVKGFAPYVIPDYNFSLKDDDERYLHTIPYMQFPVVRDGTNGIGSLDAGCPDFDRQLRWLKLYKEMTQTGTWCYVNANIPAMIRTTSEDTMVSIYSGLDTYVVVANFAKVDTTVHLSHSFKEVSIDEVPDEAITGDITIPARKMKIYKLLGTVSSDEEQGKFSLNALMQTEN